MLDIDIGIASVKLTTPLPEIRVPRAGYVAIVPRQADAALVARFVDWLAAERAQPASAA